MVQFHLVTVATHDQGYFKTLCETCEKNKITLNVLGWGEEWKGIISKIEMMKNYVRDLPSDDVVMLIDAFDIVVLCDEKEIMSKFVEFEKILGREKIFFSQEPSPQNIGMKILRPIIFRSDTLLNSGTYISRAKTLTPFFDQVLETSTIINSQDDQKIITHLYEHHPNHAGIVLDEEHHFAYVLTPKTYITHNPYQNDIEVVETLKINNDGLSSGLSKRLAVKSTKARPCVLHAPSHQNMNQILLSLSLNNSVPTFTLKDSMKYLKYCALTTYVKEKWSEGVSNTLSFVTNPISKRFASEDRTYYVGETLRTLPKDLVILKHDVRYATPETLKGVLDVYEKTLKMFQEEKIMFWAVAGTLLGAARHQGIIPWDDDCDLGVMEEDKVRIQGINAKRYGLEIVRCSFGFFVFDAQKQSFGPKVDLFVMKEIEDEKTGNKFYRYSEPFESIIKKSITSWHDIFPKDEILSSDLFPLTVVPFETTSIPVPKNYKDVVKAQKGERALTEMPFESKRSSHSPFLTLINRHNPWISKRFIEILSGGSIMKEKGGGD